MNRKETLEAPVIKCSGNLNESCSRDAKWSAVIPSNYWLGFQSEDYDNPKLLCDYHADDIHELNSGRLFNFPISPIED
jgi:hypothetical protein